MKHTRKNSLVALAIVLTASVSACGSAHSRGGSASSTSTGPPAAKGRVTLRGTARLDGTAFDAEFIGAVVLDAGLATPCNVTIPTVVGGHFALDVFGANELAGCGRPGATVVLWTYSRDTKLYSSRAIHWPTGHAATATVDFSRADPRGAAPAVLELSGAVHRADGSQVPAGERVDAYIGNTLCGVASVRTGVFDGYILHVVGPDSIPACRNGATVTFRVDGAPIVQTIVNGSPPPRQFDLALR